MGKLKNPPFCAKFTRVRVIPSVTKMEKNDFFLSDFYNNNNNNNKIGDIKGTEGKNQRVWKISIKYRFKNEIQMTLIV